MEPNIQQAEKKAEEIRLKYNSEGFSPFPHQKILDEFTKLRVATFDFEDETTSGAIAYDATTEGFVIYINSVKSVAEQYLALVFELGHFFLHESIIIEKTVIFDSSKDIGGGNISLISEDSLKQKMTIEANVFTSNIVMPQTLVTEAWQRLKTVEDCASIFNVPVIEMAIRLKNLGLLKEE